MLARLFRRLHTQIVIPLVIGAVFVAIVATIIAVNIVSRPIEALVRTGLDHSSDAAKTRFDQNTVRLRKFAKVVVESGPVAGAISKGSIARVRQVVIPVKIALDVDFLAVLDRQGRVQLCVGAAHMQHESIARTRLFRLGKLEMNAADVLHTHVGPALASIAPVRDPSGVTGYVVLGDLISAGFLQELREEDETPLTLLDANGRTVTATTLRGKARRKLLPTRSRLAVAQRAIGARDPAKISFSSDGADYIASHVPLFVDERSVGVLEVIQPTTGIAATKRSTAALIAWWSGVAVFVLFGLGMYIAMRVSRPIRRLAESARTVASGDLSPKLEVHGHDELAELSTSFNSMTASLREQTAALTKRLVELYAFYDMSKALGTTLELDMLLNTVLDSALKVLHADSGYIMLIERETDDLVMKACRGVGGEGGKPEEVSESIGRWVLQEGKPLLFGEGRYKDVAFPTAEEAPKSAICVPLRVKDSVIGVITASNSSTESQFSDENVRLLSTLAGNAAVAIENAQLFKSLEEAYMGTVKALAAAIDAKDSYTQGHSSQVARYCLMLAEEIALSEDERKAVETAAYLHDIGKIGVRDEVLLKPGRLSLQEMNEIRHHSMISANILAPVPFPWQVTPIVRHHHERWDGSGYPAGLKGHEIPLLARILAVADAFDAMTSRRPYRKRRTFREAIDELKVCAGTHFDPELIGPFISAVEKNELPGALRGHPSTATVPERFDREEIRAIFVSIANGLLASFRRLGGPRVAANVEEELNAELEAKKFPLSFQQGYLSARWDRDHALKSEIAMFHETLEMEYAAIESRVGNGIVTRFYREVLDGLSSRFRVLATRFGLDTSIIRESSHN